MFDRKTKYPPEMIAKWVKDLASGKVDKDGIMQRYNISQNELNRRLRTYDKPKA